MLGSGLDEVVDEYLVGEHASKYNGSGQLKARQGKGEQGSKGRKAGRDRGQSLCDSCLQPASKYGWMCWFLNDDVLARTASSSSSSPSSPSPSLLPLPLDYSWHTVFSSMVDAMQS